jgi:hypothetical protein
MGTLVPNFYRHSADDREFHSICEAGGILLQVHTDCQEMFNAFRLLMMHVEDTVPDLTFSLVELKSGRKPVSTAAENLFGRLLFIAQ